MRRQLAFGMRCGWAFWLLLYVGAFAIEASETYWPRLLRDADVPDTLASVLLVAALPVAFGGWLLVGGEQPPAWASSLPFALLFGMAIYGGLGVLAARHWGAIAALTRRALRGMMPLFSKRAIPWIVVIAAIFAAWMVDRNKVSEERRQRAVKALAVEKAKMDAARVE